MATPVMPWYDINYKTAEEWKCNCYLKDSYFDFIDRTKTHPLNQDSICGFFSEYISEFKVLDEAILLETIDKEVRHAVITVFGACSPSDVGKWEISISSGNTDSEQGISAIHEMLHGFYRAYGSKRHADVIKYMRHFQRFPPRVEPKRCDEILNAYFTELTIEKLSIEFYLKNELFVQDILESRRQH
jgi:hypothetical protein